MLSVCLILNVWSNLFLLAFIHDLSVLDPHPGMESLKKVFPAFIRGLPDVRIELQQQIIEGNRIASHWIFQGTHAGDLYGIPPFSEHKHHENRGRENCSIQ